MFKLLVIDDDPEFIELIRHLLRKEFDVVAIQRKEAIGAVKQQHRRFDIILLDLKLEQNVIGLDLIQDLRASYLETPIIALSNDQEYEMQAKLSDVVKFVYKRADAKTIKNTVIDTVKALSGSYRRAQSGELPIGDGAEDMPNEPFISRYPSITAAKRLLKVAADNPDMSVLLCGETGTGKGHAIKFLHYNSRIRREKPIEEIHISHLMPNFEAALYGNLTTKAHKTPLPGLLEKANGGLVFFDEISDWDFKQQSILMRLLDKKSIRPIGSTADVPLDIQIVASTNHPFETAPNGPSGKPKKHNVRKEVVHRFDMVINLPALKERREDIPLLMMHFMRKTFLGKTLTEFRNEFSSEAYELLFVQYDWPGNINEVISMSKIFNIYKRERPYDGIGTNLLPSRMIKRNKSNGTAPNNAKTCEIRKFYLFYARDDKAYATALQRHLVPLTKGDDPIKISEESLIEPGTIKNQARAKMISESDGIIYFSSHHLINMETYTEDYETMKGKKIYRIKIRNYWDEADDVSQYTALYDTPFASDDDEIWTQIVTKLKKSIY